jgi:hypothetical protein
MKLDFYNKLIISFGIVNIIIFISVVFLYKKNMLKNFVSMIKTVYKGFDPDNLPGIIKGITWAFIDGIITGVIVAFILKILKM